MRILIIDSNEADRDRLSNAIRLQDPVTNSVHAFECMQTVFEWLNNFGQPDFIFMDIYLNDGISFEILNHLDKDVRVIFTIQSNKEIVESFNKNSVEYLLKPVWVEGLKDIFKSKAKEINRIKLYETLLTIFLSRQSKTLLRRIIVKKGSEFHIVCVKDILYFTSENGIVFLVTRENQKHIIPNTLQDLGSELDDSVFYRVNRNFIINSNFLKGFRRVGTKILLLFDFPAKEQIFVNHYSVSQFRDWLKKTRPSTLIAIPV